MEASKCPKCGDEPHFVEQVEKWYCYGCNSYVEDEEHHAEHDHNHHEVQEPKAEELATDLKDLENEDTPICKKCGATMEEVQDGKIFCSVCECSPDDPSIAAVPEVRPEKGSNEAQALLDSITVPTPAEPPSPAPVIEPEKKKEPSADIKMCPSCGQPLKYIEKYQRYYCYGCRRYAPRDDADRPKQTPPKPSAPATKTCPDCGKELKFIEKYSEHYCFSCKAYPLKAKSRANGLKCPSCGRPLRYIEKYSRHYCLACKEYAPKGYGEGPSEKKSCPFCDHDMKFVSEYNEWYCYKCKKYSLRPSKPVLLI